MKKTNFIITIFVGLVTFILGYSFSIWKNPIEQCPEPEKPLAKYLESGVIKNISAFAEGQVTGISDRNLTLNKEGKEFTILFNEDAKILRLIPSDKENTPPAIEQIKFEEIKVGDKVNAGGRLDADAVLKGDSLTILPSWY